MESNKELKHVSSLSKFFSIYIVLLPILQYYKSPLSQFNLATLLAILLLPLLFITRPRNYVRLKNLFPINVYMVFITANVLITSIIYNHPFNMVYDGAYLRMVLLFVSILYIGQYWFDIDYAIHTVEILLIASVLFMIVQFGSYYLMGYYITGKINSLITLEVYTHISRATGFYMEPAQYAQTATLYLVFKLFAKNQEINIRKIAIIICGVIMSGSGQGYFYLVVIVLLLFVEQRKKLSKEKIQNGIVILICSVIVVLIAYQIPYVQSAIARIMPSETRGFGGQALAGRSYTNRYFELLSDKEKIFGVGFGLSQTAIPADEFAYINTLYVHLIECGYFSVAIWAIMLIYMFRKGRPEVIAFLILYTIMMVFTGVGRPMMICYFFSFLLAQSRVPLVDTELKNTKTDSSEHKRITDTQGSIL